MARTRLFALFIQGRVVVRAAAARPRPKKRESRKHVDPHSIIRVLLVTIALLLGTVSGLVVGILSSLGGSPGPLAARHGGVALGGTMTLVLAVMAALGLLE